MSGRPAVSGSVVIPTSVLPTSKGCAGVLTAARRSVRAAASQHIAFVPRDELEEACQVLCRPISLPLGVFKSGHRESDLRTAMIDIELEVENRIAPACNLRMARADVARQTYGRI